MHAGVRMERVNLVFFMFRTLPPPGFDSILVSCCVTEITIVIFRFFRRNTF